MCLAQDELETCLAGISEDMLARWYVDLNGWRWPSSCPLPRPDAWSDTATFEEKQSLVWPLWVYIHAHTTAEARSRAWWLVALNRSEQDWRTFWTLPICRRCGFRHPRGQCSHPSYVVRGAAVLRRGWHMLRQALWRGGGR